MSGQKTDIKVVLKPRTAEHVRIYWEKTQDKEIRRRIPLQDISLEEALRQFEASRQPGATSFGMCIEADGDYVGDVWCYGIDEAGEQMAMFSFLIFEKACGERALAARRRGFSARRPFPAMISGSWEPLPMRRTSVPCVRWRRRAFGKRSAFWRKDGFRFTWSGRESLPISGKSAGIAWVLQAISWEEAQARRSG